MQSSLRRIFRRGGAQVKVQALGCGTSWRIAIPIGIVVGAARGDVFAPRGLRKLPNLGKPNSAGRRIWRILRECTSGRRRARVINRPINDLACTGALANVFRGDHFFRVRRNHPRTINSRAEPRGDDSIHPGKDISLLLRQHAPALLHIQKNDRAGTKAFAPRGSCGRMRVRAPQPFRIRHGLQLGIKPPIEQNEKPESRGFHRRSVPAPRIRALSRRIIEPVPRVRKSLPQGLEVGVTRIGIAVKTKISRSVVLALRDQRAQQQDDEKTFTHKQILP
jgi:hypothetical protein